MAVPIYTYQLGWVQGSTANLEYVLFTVIEGQHVILRDVVMTNYGPSPAEMRVFVRSPDTSTKYEILTMPQVPVMTSQHWDGRQELRLGDELVIRCQTPSFSCAATGYVFQL